MKKKVCIFGGTFDPPHFAHAEIIEQAKAQLEADLVIVVPCGQPVHKLYTSESKHRLEMAKLAFSHLENTVVSSFEVKKARKSFSLYTLKHFRRKYKRAELFFIIGSDSLEDFPNWYKPEELASLAQIAVVGRANHDFRKAKQVFEKTYKSKPVVFKNEPVNISATELRIMTEFGLSTEQFISGEVIKYIADNNLYSDYAGICRKAKKYLKKDRLTHTVYTAHEGLKLAKINKAADSGKVFLACVLHDVAKSVPQSDWGKYDYKNEQGLPDSIVHAELGAVIAEREFGITDETVLNAIRFHTTARPNMSLEEKIVYVADTVELSRPGMSELRKKAETDFNDGFLSCLKINYNHAVNKFGAENVHKATKKSIGFYKKEMKGEQWKNKT